LADNCNFAVISDLSTDAILTYLSPEIIDQLHEQRPKFAEMETTSSGARNREGNFANFRRRFRRARAAGLDGASDSDSEVSPSPNRERRPRKRQRLVIDGTTDSDSTMNEEGI
jgi:hypothetical protein